MKNKLFQKVLCLILSVTLLLGSMGLTVSATSLKYDPNERNPYKATTLEEMQSLVGTLPYAEYSANNAGVKPGPYVLKLDVTNFTEATNSEIKVVKDSEVVSNAITQDGSNWVDFDYDANAGSSIYLPSTGSVTWSLKVGENAEGISEAGLYYIKIEYFSCITPESSVSPIERGFLINGKIPFSEVASISLDKTWTFDYISSETTDAPGEPDSYDVDYVWGNGHDSYQKIVTSVVDGKKTVTTYTLSQDIIGNSMSPGAEATPSWSTYYLQDETGYHSGNFAFNLIEGDHQITFRAERDPVIIKSIEFVPAENAEETKSYEEYLKEHESLADKDASSGDIIFIEAEFPDAVSDSSVSPSNDNTSPVNSPVVSGTQLYNVIGETGFSSIGQWASYKFKVTDSGFYNLGMRFKQSVLQGMFVCRTLKLSGGEYGEGGTATVPFDEAYNLKFDYSDNWQSSYVTDGEQVFRFYFEEGVEYTMYLECSLGTLKEYIQAAENALLEVNAAYLRILQLTGTDPDENSDSYNFMEVMPDVLITILEQAVALEQAHKSLKEICGTNGQHIATLETIYTLFDKVGSKNGENIAANLSTLKSYLGTLGTWINDSKSSTVMVDSIVVAPMKVVDGELKEDESKLPRVEANFFESIWFEIVAFFSSFFIDYDKMGVTAEIEENIEHIDVWLASGRDQSQIWRTMIDAQGGFTDKTGVSVALKLVTGGTLLPSILSRKGPDVYLGLGSAEVINYAIRDAVLGVNGLEPRFTDEQNAIFTTERYTYKNADGTFETTLTPIDGKEVSFTTLPFNKLIVDEYGEEIFSKAALDTVMISPGIEKDENGKITALPAVCYGLPRTMQFAMMFYRMDVLADLGQEVPESWDDLLSILPVLQANNMQIGVSYVSALDFMIYQEGGNMWKYTDTDRYDAAYAGAAIDIDSEVALAAFDFTCRLYSDYSFPVSYDAANRFRTGEMPILIGSYADLYNQLVVYATEIAGLWEFCSLPGSYREETGEFNYNSLAQVTATIILNGCESRGNLLPAWQFMQWETAAEQSAEFGNRIVAIMGPSAKYETANLNAIDDLSWTASEKEAIMNQMDHMSSIVNYPGSYIISRYVSFAFLDAVNNDANAIDAMRSYIGAINSEIERKRAEFGLWVPTEEEPVPPEKETYKPPVQQ
ncbi:MAG: extracellular solute-binding protein [Clostridia bacterium]|nr:extracellular solute-binding protein [Clostridia bacterium]